VSNSDANKNKSINKNLDLKSSEKMINKNLMIKSSFKTNRNDEKCVLNDKNRRNSNCNVQNNNNNGNNLKVNNDANTNINTTFNSNTTEDMAYIHFLENWKIYNEPLLLIHDQFSTPWFQIVKNAVSRDIENKRLLRLGNNENIMSIVKNHHYNLSMYSNILMRKHKNKSNKYGHTHGKKYEINQQIQALNIDNGCIKGNSFPVKIATDYSKDSLRLSTNPIHKYD
jgi:hypothetical protein